MDTHRIARVIRSLSEVERDWLNCVLELCAKGPASLRDLWSEAWFGASSARGLIIERACAGAFFYVPVRTWSERVCEIGQTLKVAMLFDLLVAADLVQIHHAVHPLRDEVRCIGAIFSGPRVEVVGGKPRIVINEAGDYTEDPATIVSSAGEVLYRSVRLGHDAFDLLHWATQGMLLIRPVDRAVLLAALQMPDRLETAKRSSDGGDALRRPSDVAKATDVRDDHESAEVRRSASNAYVPDIKEHPDCGELQEGADPRAEASGRAQSCDSIAPTRRARRWFLIGTLLAHLCVAAAGLTLAKHACIQAGDVSDDESRKTGLPSVPASVSGADRSGKAELTVAVDCNAAIPKGWKLVSSELGRSTSSGALFVAGIGKARWSGKAIGAFRPECDGEEVATVDSRSAQVLGLDVSQWSGKGKSGAEAVFAVAPCIDFAFARVAYGTRRDPEFLENWRVMEKQGIYRGAYLFLRLDQDPIEQVDAAVDTIGPPGQRDLCLTIDIEPASFPFHAPLPNVTTVHRIMVAALQRVEEAMKCVPIIYTDWDTGHDYLGAVEFGRFPLWIADWTKASSPRLPPAWSDFEFWQRSDHIQNSPTPADLDIFNGSAADLKRLVRSVSPRPATDLSQ
ncbi:GH25 family lysozyme [Paraburkholderia azotifigens]|uniref:glycoside hydrolase family 25 protein n=1 Tax=Paraburkholderia azotifigens TaxID=2057004 RepID=UPI00316E8D92